MSYKYQKYMEMPENYLPSNNQENENPEYDTVGDYSSDCEEYDPDVYNNDDDQTSDQSSGNQQYVNNKFAVVFYVNYIVGRPLESAIVKYFNDYGEVSHVKCPENCEYAFVYMLSLKTDAPTKRTRTIIHNIKNDMKATNRFIINVANSKNRNNNYDTYPRYNNMNRQNNYDNPRYNNYNPRYNNMNRHNYNNQRYNNQRYDNPRYNNQRSDNPRYDNQRYHNPRYDNTRPDNQRYNNNRYGNDGYRQHNDNQMRNNRY